MGFWSLGSSLIYGAGAIHKYNQKKNLNLLWTHDIFFSLKTWFELSFHLHLNGRDTVIRKNQFAIPYVPGILRYLESKHSGPQEKKKVRQKKKIKFLLCLWLLWDCVLKISLLTAILRRGGGEKVATMPHSHWCPPN